MKSSYNTLKVWKISVDFATDVFEFSDYLLKKKRYLLADQVQRACVSIPSNIAEGRGRGSDKEFIRYLRISYGSLCELETHFEISKNINLLSPEKYEVFVDRAKEIGRMINGLISSLKKADD